MWINSFLGLLTIFGIVFSDVIFTKERCDPFFFGGLQSVSSTPNKYRQCAADGTVWIVPCAPGALFNPVEKVCRDENTVTGTSRISNIRNRPLPNSAIGGVIRPIEDVEEFVFTTRRPPKKGTKRPKGKRIKTTTPFIPTEEESEEVTVPSTVPPTVIPTIRPRNKLIKQTKQTYEVVDFTRKSEMAFTPPTKRVQTTQRQTTQTRRVTRPPTTTTTTSTTTVTVADYEDDEEVEEQTTDYSTTKQETESPTQSSSHLWTSVPPSTPIVSSESSPPIRISQPIQPRHPYRPSTMSSLPRLPPSSIPTLFPSTTRGIPTISAPIWRGTSKEERIVFVERQKSSSTLPPPSSEYTDESSSEYPLPFFSSTPPSLNSLYSLPSSTIRTTTQFPTLLTMPPYIYEKQLPKQPQVQQKIVEYEKKINVEGLSKTDKEFLQELMGMLRAQKETQEKMERAEKAEEERQRKLLERMTMQPVFVSPTTTQSPFHPIPKIEVEYVPYNPNEESQEYSNYHPNVKVIQSPFKPPMQAYPTTTKQPKTQVYPYAQITSHIPSYAGHVSSEDGIRPSTPEVNIIRFPSVTPTSEWVTSSDSWRPPPEWNMNTDATRDNSQKQVTTPPPIRYLTGCIPGTTCPLLGNEEQLCEHPSIPSMYLQCVPTSVRGGLWTERSCPDTLLFVGDRCDTQDFRTSLLGTVGNGSINNTPKSINTPPTPASLTLQTTRPQTTTYAPSTTTPPLSIPFQPYPNEVYTQWKGNGISSPSASSIVSLPAYQSVSPTPTHSLYRTIDSFPRDLMTGGTVDVSQDETIDYSQVFPLFPRVQPRFLQGDRRRAPTQVIRKVDQQQKVNSSQSIKEDYIMDKVVGPALHKLAVDNSKSLFKTFLLNPIEKFDRYLASKIDGMTEEKKEEGEKN